MAVEMMAVAVDVMAVAVPSTVPTVATVPAVPAMAVSTGDSRAIDRQRGRAQRKNRNRRNNEFSDSSHGHLPICAARSSLCCDRNVDLRSVMRCDRGHTGHHNAPVDDPGKTNSPPGSAE